MKHGEAWCAAVHGAAELDMTEWLWPTITNETQIKVILENHYQNILEYWQSYEGSVVFNVNWSSPLKKQYIIKKYKNLHLL